MDIPPAMLAAHEALAPIVMAIPGVKGVEIVLKEIDGNITDEFILRVMVVDLNAIPDGIPQEIQGISVVLTQGSPQTDADLAYYPRAIGGTSIGAILGILGESGTFGGIARDVATGDLRGITCKHVIGNVPGTVIYQPEPTVANPPARDRLGVLDHASYPAPNPLLPIQPYGYTDAASFTIERTEASAEIVDIIDPFITHTSIGQVTGGERVMKRGRTTLLTYGSVISGVGNYQNEFGDWLFNQIAIRADAARSPIWSAKGDSGSLVVNEDTREIVGLHWGSDAGGTIGYASHIGITSQELGISFIWPAPQIQSVSPMSSNPQGGTTLTLTGSGFQLAYDVKFGLLSARSFKVINDKRIEAVTPVGVGLVPVFVIGPGGTSAPMMITFM